MSHTCGRGQKKRFNSQDEQICCNTRQCKINYTFESCPKDNTDDICKKCQSGYVNPDGVSDTGDFESDIAESLCKPPQCKCDPEARIVNPEKCQNGSEPVQCVCDKTRLWYGVDPKKCERAAKPCNRIGEELKNDGRCGQCRAGYEKLQPDNSTCVPNSDMQKNLSGILSTSRPKAGVLSGNVISSTVEPVIQTSTIQNNSTDVVGNSTDVATLTILLPVFGGLLLLAIGIICIYRKYFKDSNRRLKCPSLKKKKKNLCSPKTVPDGQLEPLMLTVNLPLSSDLNPDVKKALVPPISLPIPDDPQMPHPVTGFQNADRHDTPHVSINMKSGVSTCNTCTSGLNRQQLPKQYIQNGQLSETSTFELERSVREQESLQRAPAGSSTQHEPSETGTSGTTNEREQSLSEEEEETVPLQYFESGSLQNSDHDDKTTSYSKSDNMDAGTSESFHGSDKDDDASYGTDINTGMENGKNEYIKSPSFQGVEDGVSIINGNKNANMSNNNISLSGNSSFTLNVINIFDGENIVKHQNISDNKGMINVEISDRDLNTSGLGAAAGSDDIEDEQKIYREGKDLRNSEDQKHDNQKLESLHKSVDETEPTFVDEQQVQHNQVQTTSHPSVSSTASESIDMVPQDRPVGVVTGLVQVRDDQRPRDHTVQPADEGTAPMLVGNRTLDFTPGDREPVSNNLPSPLNLQSLTTTSDSGVDNDSPTGS